MFKTWVFSGIFRYVHLKAENHFQPNQIGKSRMGAFQRFLHCKNAMILVSKNTGLVFQEHLLHVFQGSCDPRTPGNVLVLQECSLGGGGQLPPAVLFFQNRDLFYIEALAAVGSCLRRFYFFKTGTFFTQALAALYRLPPAGRFFEKWTPKNTSLGVVVQVASGGSIF